jgi:hypothetical protein
MKKRYYNLAVFVLLMFLFVYVAGSAYVKNQYLLEGITGRVLDPISGGSFDYCVGSCTTSSGSACPEGQYASPSGPYPSWGFCGEGQFCCLPDDEIVCEGGAGICADYDFYGCDIGDVPISSNLCFGTSTCCLSAGNCMAVDCDPYICGDGTCDWGETCTDCLEDCEGEKANCGGHQVCSASGECSYCGNGICEPSRDETCENCYLDCQGLQADCGEEEVCLHTNLHFRPAECVISCSNFYACGCFLWDCPQSNTYSGPPSVDLFEWEDLSMVGHSDEEIYDGGSGYNNVIYNCLELSDNFPNNDPQNPEWLDCKYLSATQGRMETLSEEYSPECIDGTPRGGCSLTQPLHCNSNDELVSLCSDCGCSIGYYCDIIGGEVCLINQSYIELEITLEGDDNKGASGEFSLWKQLQNTYGIDGEGSAVSATILRKFAEGDDKGIMKSPGSLITEVVKTEDLDLILDLDKEIVKNTEEKIKSNAKIFEEGKSEEIEELLFNGESVIGGGFVGGIVMRAAAAGPENESNISFSPVVEEAVDIIEIPCVNEDGGNCVGRLSRCCEGLNCNAGICISNEDVISVQINVTDGDEGEDSQEIHDNFGFSEIVDISGAVGGISVVEYETHPVEIPSLYLPDSITFGFYDIKVENEIGASLSFEVLNDLLVMNQIMAIGLYRLSDDGWESLDLEEIVFSSERTRFTFNTEGFSYFTLKGVKEGINFASATDQDSSLWSVYRRSFTPGFSLIEFFIGEHDTIIFGIFNNAPLIDLGLSGF